MQLACDQAAIWVSSAGGEAIHFILLLATASKHSSLLPEERTSASRLAYKISPLNESRAADSEVSIMMRALS